MCSGSDLFLALLSVLFPPIGVWIKRGICTADSLINIALCCLGYLPGLLHAWYIISVYPEPDYTSIPQDQEGQYTVWYVSSGGPAPHGQPQYGNQQQGGRTYGTLRTPSGGQFVGQQSGTTNSFKAPKPQRQSGGERQGEQGQNAAGSSQRPDETPPSYQDVIQADNKIQSSD
ncbi:UPF0057-domain-containing protein [Rhizodiscina lignyota]|uniref:UPF0057-domain-containing protein n=1 Tax=Rhizodiscina lignyota TaxID=1504668 RepID=A0A9P4INJ0_9PEZI|nr:UPF0057-domain-containing protein [Rhizodiscina lignyota]